MARLLGSVALLLVFGFAPAAQAQAPQPPAKLRIGKAIGVGALAGGAAGAVVGASWGERMADGADALSGAGILGGVGAASGAISGATNALLPQRRGWKKFAQAAAVGMAVSGLTFWVIGELNGNVGPIHADDFRKIGLAHGAITGVVTVRFGR